MEEEISLTEIFVTLWQGRYIIIAITVAAALIAALASIVLQTPLYRAKALADPAVLEMQASDIAGHPEAATIVEEIIDSYDDENRVDILKVCDISEGSEGLIEVEVCSTDPALAAEAADTLALGLLRWARDYELGRMNHEKNLVNAYLEMTNEQISMVRTGTDGVLSDLDEEIEEFKTDYDTSYEEAPLEIIDQQMRGIEFAFHTYYEEMLEEKEVLEDALVELDRFILAHFGEMSPAEKTEAMEFNPAFQAVKEKKGHLLTSLFDVEQSIKRLESDELVDVDILTETVFENVVGRRDQLRNELLEMTFQISRLELSTSEQDLQQLIYPVEIPENPFNIRWQLNTAVATVLGLMMSVMIVFIKPYVREVVIAAKESAKEHE